MLTTKSVPTIRLKMAQYFSERINIIISNQHEHPFFAITFYKSPNFTLLFRKLVLIAVTKSILVRLESFKGLPFFQRVARLPISISTLQFVFMLIFTFAF